MLKSLLLVIPALLLGVLAGCDEEKQSAAAATPQPVTTPRSAPAPWKPVPFDRSSGRVNINDAAAFFGSMKKTDAAMAKGEFETSSAHRARVKAVPDALLPISTEVDYAFALTNGGLRYDADASAYRVDPGPSCMPGYPFDGATGCLAGEVTTYDSDNDGRTTIPSDPSSHLRRLSDFYFLFAKKDMSRSFTWDGTGYRLGAACPVPVAKARTLARNDIQGVLVVRISGPGLTDGSTRFQEATSASPVNQEFVAVGAHATPVAFVCAVVATGEILGYAPLASQR